MAKTKVYHQKIHNNKYYYVDSEEVEAFENAEFIIKTAIAQKKIGKEKIKKYKFKLKDDSK